MKTPTQNKYRFTYFPMEDRWTVWQEIEGKAPICLNGYDTKNWLHTIEEAREWLKKIN